MCPKVDCILKNAHNTRAHILITLLLFSSIFQEAAIDGAMCVQKGRKHHIFHYTCEKTSIWFTKNTTRTKTKE